MSNSQCIECGGVQNEGYRPSLDSACRQSRPLAPEERGHRRYRAVDGPIVPVRQVGAAVPIALRLMRARSTAAQTGRPKGAAAIRACVTRSLRHRVDLPVTLRQQAAAQRATLADQAAATFIDLADPDTVKWRQRLAAMAILTLARAGAVEIIPASFQPEELP